MVFWDRVKFKIKRNNLTQEAVARQVGVSLNTFKGWIAKDIMPAADVALKIAKSLGTTLEYLLSTIPDHDMLPQAMEVRESGLGYYDHDDSGLEMFKLYQSLSPELQAVALAQLRVLAGVKPERSSGSSWAGQKPAAG